MYAFRQHAQYRVAASLQGVAPDTHRAHGGESQERQIGVTLVAHRKNGCVHTTRTVRATCITYAGTPYSTRTNGATSTSRGSAADGAASLAPTCGSVIMCADLQAGVVTGHSQQASHEKGCRNSWYLEQWDEHGSHVPA